MKVPVVLTAKFLLLVLVCAANAAAADDTGANAKVGRIVADWETWGSVFDDPEVYAGQMRELVELGEAALPVLTATLDKETRDVPLRFLAFTLRAIGDARAAPALIRAFPRTLLLPSSDCGVNLEDAGLLRFMLTHDLAEGEEDKRLKRRNFDMGRPVREVAAALKKITGNHLNEAELFHTFLEGGEQQRALQRQEFYKVAHGWADWWEAHWKEFTNDPKFAEVRLPALTVEPTLRRFAIGPNMKATEGTEGMVLSPAEEGGRTGGLVLGLSRIVSSPKNLAGTADNLDAWGARAGVDLLGTRYRDADSGKSYYAARGVGLQAWEVGNEHWTKIDEELQQGTLPSLDNPAGDLLMHYDSAQRKYLPEKRATFLFITRDGLQGILRVVAQVTRNLSPREIGMPAIRRSETSEDQNSEGGFELGVKIDYKFFYAETEEMKVEAKARQEARASRLETRQRRKMAAMLEKYPHLIGKVSLPNGEAASNAVVVLAVGRESVVLGNRRFEYTNNYTLVVTGGDGSFVLPQPPKSQALYAVHDYGFCELELEGTESTVTLQLQPFGKIEGTVTLNGKPAPHQRMSLLYDVASREQINLSLFHEAFTTDADEAGHFRFENLPPREVQVYRMIDNTYCAGIYVDVAPGRTTTVTHGFDGRMVTGHLLSSDGADELPWKGQRLRLSTKAAQPEPPAGVNARVWINKYWQSPKGREQLRKNRNFPVIVEANGEFRIDDVPAGTYQLEGDLREGGSSDPWSGGKVLGRVKEEIVIQQPETGKEHAEVDLGKISAQMVKNLKIGDVAPDFEVKTVDGGRLRLTDFKGKYVLLDFWATWCGPCRAETPNVKAVYAAHGKNPEFAMIGLSLDNKPDAPADYAKKEGLSWAQGFLGDWSKATLPARYGVEGIPATFLIDPEGKIMATDLRGEGLADVIGAALPSR